MNRYEKPMIVPAGELSENVFASSGAVASDANSNDNGIKCDSIYMKGVWQAPDYSQWAQGESRGYKQQFGCLGCPANTANGCGLLTHYVDSNYASSYQTDNGKRKPSWEKKGYLPDDAVTDWAM